MVVTSDEKGAGTDANVKITVYGSLGDSGKRPLEKRWRDLFERGQTDDFELEIIDLGGCNLTYMCITVFMWLFSGELERIKLEHDNKMLKPDWKPQKVVISEGNK